jgi:hypothetical protein
MKAVRKVEGSSSKLDEVLRGKVARSIQKASLFHFIFQRNDILLFSIKEEPFKDFPHLLSIR